MKAAKIFGIILGALVLLIVAVVVIALLPGVQTWAVRKFAGDQPGLRVEVGRVAAGFSAADIRDLRVVKDGMVITAKGVSANYSAWDYLTRKKIDADQITVQELIVDLRAMTPAAKSPQKPGEDPGTKAGTPGSRPASAGGAPEKQEPFSGILAQAKLPFDLRVAKLIAKGRALLPQDQSVVFDLQGANIATGQRGTLNLQADFTDAKKDAAIASLHVTGTITVHIAVDRRIDLVETDIVAAAEGPKLPKEQIKLVAKAEQPAAGTNESYTLLLSIVRGNTTEPLLKSAAEFSPSTRELAGAWDLAIRSEQLAAVLAGLGLPEIAATGGGRFSFKPETGAVAASGDLNGNVSHLEKVAAELASIGTMQFRATFDAGMADNVARLEKLQLDLTAAGGRRLAQINTLQRVRFSLADKRLMLENPKAEVARVAIDALPLAWAQPFVKDLAIDSGDFSLALAVEAEPDGSRVRVRAVEPLTLRTVTIRKGKDKLVDQLSLTANPRVDYSATRVIAELADITMSMPAGDAISGTMSVDVTSLAKNPIIAFTSQLEAKLVTAHKPYVPVDTGPLAVATRLQGRLAGDVLNVAKSSSTITREGGALLAALELQQPVTANLKAGTFTVPSPTATAARVKLGEVPLAWMEPFVAKSKFAGVLSGATLEISARSLDDVTLNTTEPLLLRGVSVTLDGKPLLQAVDAMANLTATKRGDIVNYNVRRLELKQGEALLAAVVVAGEANLGKKFSVAAKGNLEADAGALLKQPVAAEFATISRGRVTSTFDATLGDAIQAKAVLAARGLVAKQDNRPLGDLEVNLSANMKPDGSGGTIAAPITLTNGSRKSDIAVDGTFGKSKDGKKFLFDGRVVSNQLFVEDFQPLAGLAPGAEPATPTTAPAARTTPPTKSSPTRTTSTTPRSAPGTSTTASTAPKSTTPAKPDTEPFWSAVQGKATVDLKNVVYSREYTIRGVRGSATITQNRLSLDGLEGLFNQNPFKANAALVFDAKQPKPYALTGVADVQNFDVGALLRAANPNEQPALESKVTVKANLNGSAGNVGELAKNVYGSFELNGSQGVMRALARRGKAGAAVDILSTGLAIFGAAKGSETTVAMAELVRAFAAVPFDSFKMQVERAADLSLKITSIEFISPQIRLTGSGTVANRPNVPLPDQPMQILLQLGARSEYAHLLNRVRMLGEKQDEKGYQLLTRTFTVGGTASKPDSGVFWQLVGSAISSGALPGIGDLLQRGLGGRE